jgi:hypothetical protein
MKSGPSAFPELHAMSAPWRVLLTVGVLFIAAGYGAATLNVLAQNELTDGKPGLTLQDVLLKYSGGYVERAAGEAAPSRMLEMIQGSMRQYFSDDASFEVVLNWLKAGAAREGFGGSGNTPESVLLTDCLRCHAGDSGADIAATAPFGPNLFTVDYDAVSRFTLAAAPGETRVWRAPRGWRELALTTHVHMLSVPVFVMVIAVLFLWTGWPSGHSALRSVLGSAPLVLFFVDVACWWLARLPEYGWVFAGAIPVTGALFGPLFLLQILVVLRGLWRPPRAIWRRRI